MRNVSVAVLAAVILAPAAVYADDAVAYPNALTLADGAVAVPERECGQGDVCATITLANKDVITVYSEGAQKGKPYKVHVVRTHGDMHLVDYEVELTQSTALNALGAYFTFGFGGQRTQSHGELVLDNGALHVGLYQNHNGNLFAHVWATDPTNATILPAPAASPSSP